MPACRSASATVASAAARENLVGGRNSRTRSQRRAAATSPAAAASTASWNDARRIVVHTTLLAAARAGSSPRAAAASAAASADARHAEIPSAPTEHDLRRSVRRAHLPAGVGGVAEDEGRLRVGQGELDVAGRLPRIRAARGGRSGEHDARRHDRREGSNGHYWAISTFSRAAACVT